MIVNPVFSKSGKGLNFILEIKQINRPKTFQTASQETQTSNLFERREISGRAPKARRITCVYILMNNNFRWS